MLRPPPSFSEKQSSGKQYDVYRSIVGPQDIQNRRKKKNPAWKRPDVITVPDTELIPTLMSAITLLMSIYTQPNLQRNIFVKKKTYINA